MGKFTTIVWDNNDFNEETLSGRGTTHVVNGIVIKRGELAHNSKATVSKKIRTVKVPERSIQSYYNTQKGLPSLYPYNTEHDLDLHNTRHLQKTGIHLGFAYILCRIYSTDIGDIIPGWTGFNSQLAPSAPDVSNIGYLPVIDSPAADMAKGNEIQQQSTSICQRLNIPEIVLVFDEAIYAKFQMIRWKEEEHCHRFVVRRISYNYVLL